MVSMRAVADEREGGGGGGGPPAPGVLSTTLCARAGGTAEPIGARGGGTERVPRWVCGGGTSPIVLVLCGAVAAGV